MNQTVEFANTTGDDVYYIDKKNDVKRGIIKSCEVKAGAISYIINSDRIPEVNIKDTFDDIKTKMTEEVQKDYDAKVAKIADIKVEDFETEEEKEAKEVK